MQEKADRNSYKPVRVPFVTLRMFLRRETAITMVDQYRDLVKSQFLLRHPRYRYEQGAEEAFRKYYTKRAGKRSYDKGVWFYFPWQHSLVHYLSEAEHQELRTGRNRELITQPEQQKFYRAAVAVLGMSVGSHVAQTLVMTGGAKNITLADPDVLSGDNLNRIRDSFQNIGTHKAILVARKLYEMNPYSSVTLYRDGLNEDNIHSIVRHNDIIIDEMDNPFWKVRIREEARKHGVPVIMGTDNGDGIIVDIERYDQDGHYPILHGLAQSLASEDFKALKPKDMPRVAAKIAGANIATLRMLQSVGQVGRTLYSWPQLGTAATLCGSAIAYVARRVVLKDILITSGRYEVSLDSIFEMGYNTKKNTDARRSERDQLLRQIGV